MPGTHRRAEVTAQRVLTEEDLSALIADAMDASWLDLSRRPLPAVLDTDFVRTGLHYQLRNGIPPRSVRTAQRGSLRLFMEYDTLTETEARLPKFADQLGVPVADLRRVLNEDWLPHVDVVKLPASLRRADPRALQVRDRDIGDFPAGALAALLSPCLLLTCNYKHFGALGVRTRSQAVDGVMAVAAINIGEMQVQVIVMIPAAPAMAAGAAVKWASDRFGPVAWVILGVLIGGGFYWYRKQPPERRERVKQVSRRDRHPPAGGVRDSRRPRQPGSHAAACLRGAQPAAADTGVRDHAGAGAIAGVAFRAAARRLARPVRAALGGRPSCVLESTRHHGLCPGAPRRVRAGISLRTARLSP